MTDKELLELAAKAAGAEITGRKGNEPIYSIEREIEPGEYEYTRWNPLEKSPSGRSDCLQMEIDLEFMIQKETDPDSDDYGVWFCFHRGCEIAKDKDRQRASTMAAAEIGKNLSA